MNAETWTDNEAGVIRPPEKLLLTLREAADMLSVCERTLWGMTKKGEVPVIRLGRAVRYAVDDLRAFVDRQREQAVLLDKPVEDVQDETWTDDTA